MAEGDVQAGIEFIYHMREHLVDVILGDQGDFHSIFR